MNEWIDAERHVARADELSESGQWDAAAQELRQAVRKVPDQDDWQFHLGLALERIERFEEAAGVFEEVLRLRGPEFDSLLHLGMNRLWSGNPGGAETALEQAERLDSDRHESFCYRIAAYADLDRPEQAELMFYRAQQIGDDCPSCYEHLGASLLRAGEFRKAGWCWQQSLKLDPDREHLPRILGQTYWHLGEMPLAQHFLEEALKADACDADSLLTLGVLHLEMGRTAEATERLRWAVEVDPGMILAHVYLGELALLRGNVSAARARFERAQEIDTGFPGVSAGLARVTLAEGDRAAARGYARAELGATEHSPAQRLDLGRLLIELNLAREAITVLDALVDDVEKDEQMIRLLPEALLARGAARVLRGAVRDGVSDMRRAAALDPEHVVAAQSLGLIFLGMGHPRRAGAWLRRADQLAPGNRDVRRLRLHAGARLGLARLRRLFRRMLGR